MENSGRTLVCSVVFLDIAEYSKKPVAEQLQLKQSFNGILGSALDQVPVRDRIILDTGDGAAIAFIGDPEDALFSAMSIRDSAGALPVRLGVNLGPVRLLKDLNGQMNIIGDGINVAQRVMGFARPGQLLVSRSFYEVVSRLSRDYEKLFFHEGSRTDKHVRAHEVYSVGSGIPAGRRVVDTVARMRESGGGKNWLSATGPLGLNRAALLAASLVFVALVAFGVTMRGRLERNAISAAPAEQVLAPRAKANAASTPKSTLAPKSTVAPKPTPTPKSTRAEPRREHKTQAAAAARLGTIRLAIAPWGRVIVDGKERGVSPPLRQIEVPLGPHTVEIRNTTFPSHVAKIEVKAGQAVKIKHRFR
ncbi:MAG TPA: PEGA domain-containing protein [Burkholderiales bacterium]|nr:PEGA domain-containing protein [Burkholderiales bacterium]